MEIFKAKEIHISETSIGCFTISLKNKDITSKDTNTTYIMMNKICSIVKESTSITFYMSDSKSYKIIEIADYYKELTIDNILKKIIYKHN